MTSKMIALRLLDWIFVAFAAILLLAVAGMPLDDLIGMSSREFRAFDLFMLFATLCLSHAIATSDSAP